MAVEIERKWFVGGWPDAELPLLKEEEMEQGYLSVRPTVRIRSERPAGGEAAYILCFKSGGGIARREIEIPVGEAHFEELRELIGLPLIRKLRRTYLLPDGMRLEVSHVDEGLPEEFWYAEIEYSSEEEARRWDPAAAGLDGYLSREVTDVPGSSMGAYWKRTREKSRAE